MIKVLFYDKTRHQLEEELTLLEKLGQQVISVLPSLPPFGVTDPSHSMSYTATPVNGWWVTVRLPADDDAVTRSAYNLGVEACAEYLEKEARDLRNTEPEQAFLADYTDTCAGALRNLKRKEAT